LKSEFKAFGLQTELYQYISVVLPAIDVFIISFIAYTSANPWLTTPLNLLIPVFGVLSVRSSEKYNMLVPTDPFVLFAMEACKWKK
jgi:hypothetical protein